MDITDKALLNILQFSFPLTTTPWQTIAEQLSLPEPEIIQRIERLKKSGVVRQISPIFDSKKIGYHSTLAAFEVPEHHIDEVAQEVSKHKGVSHNYLRDNIINLWFTVTIPQEHSLEAEVESIAQRLNIENWFFLPSEKTYNIGFKLNMNKETITESSTVRTTPTEIGHTTYDKTFISKIQHDLPLVPYPYSSLSQELSMSEEDIVEQLQHYIAIGYVRRVAAVLRPTKAGFTHNVMVGWETTDTEASDKLGMFASSLEAVSHSYRRKKQRHWPISVYTMIHGQSVEDIEEAISRICVYHKPLNVVSLKTIREFKKVRVLYYVDK